MLVVQNHESRLTGADVRALAQLLLGTDRLSANDGEEVPTTTVITIEHIKGGKNTAKAKPSVDTPYLTVAEAAAYCRRAPKTILNHHCLGNIRSMPGTRPLLFLREDLDQWLSTRRKSRTK